MRPFALTRPTELDQARLRVLQSPAEREFRAGGVDLLDRMKEGLIAPSELVELGAIRDGNAQVMRQIAATNGGGLSLGALVTLAELAAAEALRGPYAAVSEAAGSAATPGIRNLATLGGNLLQRPRCWYYRHAELPCLKKGGKACLAIQGENKYHAILGGGPSFIVHPSTLACALVALDAGAIVVGDAARTPKLAELFVSPKDDPTREHNLAAGEILTDVRLPPAAAEQRSGYLAVKEKQSHDWPLAEAAVRVTMSGGVMKDVRVVLGHVAPVPWRSAEAEAVLEGKAPAEALFAEAARAALFDARPLRHNAYKIPLVQGLLRELLHRLTGVPLPE